MTKKALLIVALIAAAQMTMLASRAQAMDQDTRTVIHGGTYGLIGGTIVGIAVLPLTGSARGVFIGSSLGLYMGIIAGVYRITHRDEAGNSLRGQQWKWDVDPELVASRENPAPTRSLSPLNQPPDTWVTFSYPVLSF
jgi:hypothetical protein